MAETVKKSRIVSDEDENLEEALLEEFNMRLKSCMSKDNLNDMDDEEIVGVKSEETVKNLPKNGTDCLNFIESERQHYYDTVEDVAKRNGHHPQHHDYYEVVQEKTENSDQYVEMKNPEINVANDEVTYEPIDERASGKSSIKDRLFLSTDDAAATLLFTQTVTSPMLTPSEENIDFLKGFQKESESLPKDDEKVIENDEVHYENAENRESFNEYENLKPTENVEDVDVDEHIYQDIEDCNKEVVYEDIEKPPEDVMVENTLYENVENEVYETVHVVTQEKSEIKSEVKSEIVSNNTEITSENVTSETTSENVTSEIKIDTSEAYTDFVHLSKTENNYYEKYTEVVTKNVEINNREKDTETVPAEIVKNLKSQFSKVTENQAPKKEIIDDVRNYKTVNIIEQINKFELKSSGDEEEDSTVTECYTETTTIQTDAVTGDGEKALKKKKTKKSRKEEKENISVNDVVLDGVCVYNVNVKSLCRSFGDLSCNNTSKRNKSLSEVLLSSNNKTSIENVFSEVSVRALKEKFNIFENKNPLGIVKTNFKSTGTKSSFSKFDALQKKNILHVRSSDSAKAQDKFNDTNQTEANNCKSCSKQVFQMEQIKAERAVWHKNCFRCTECKKQLTVETYVSHEGNLYCKPHFKSLFAPKVVEDDAPVKPRKPEPIIRENQPLELPPGVVRASDKPDLGLEELQSLNVKERFQVFEQHQSQDQEIERGSTPVNVKRSPSILSKLAKFQAKGMDVGVSDDALNGIPIEESSSENENDEEEEEIPEGEDPTLYRARKAQKEKPFHFTNLSEVKNKWEQGDPNKDERREERKQEIQSIRNKLFMGKQGKMKEAYQQAVMQSESCVNVHKSEKIESYDTKSLKEKFEKGEVFVDREKNGDGGEESEVYQSEISKNSRSLFLELDANASKAPQISPVLPQKLEVKKAREAYLAKTASEDTVKSSEVIEDVVEVKTADIQQRFKFFETYKEPEKERKKFRITPPRDPSQVKTDTPEREIYHDPDIVRAEDYVDDSVIAKTTHTASKMLNKFRQMEENLSKSPEPTGPKPLKRFTPPPEPSKQEESEEESGSEEEDEDDNEDQCDNQKLPEDLIEAQKAARARQLRAKFEKWEAEEIKKEQNQSVNIMEEYGDESQIESTKTLRARFESMKESPSEKSRSSPRVKVNRFV